ncbi:MAG: hypothetical protein GPOALKHO_001103 [Sodalis sp.]|nr:MAG: hypothetical protein GPOALKHO_001103 [Sodalis sp.]
MTPIDINQLTVSYASLRRPLQAVCNISLSLNKR